MYLEAKAFPLLFLKLRDILGGVAGETALNDLHPVTPPPTQYKTLRVTLKYGRVVVSKYTSGSVEEYYRRNGALVPAGCSDVQLHIYIVPLLRYCTEETHLQDTLV